MTDNSVTIIIAVIGALGGGGLGAALVSWLASRKTVDTNVTATLMAVAETRIQAYTARTEALEKRVDELECLVNALRGEVNTRENMIEALQRENDGLKLEIKKLIAEDKCKDKKIADLTERIHELEVRINSMNEEGDG